MLASTVIDIGRLVILIIAHTITIKCIQLYSRVFKLIIIQIKSSITAITHYNNQFTSFNLCQLPDSTVLLIYAHLDFTDIFALRQCNQRFYNLSDSLIVWANKHIQIKLKYDTIQMVVDHQSNTSFLKHVTHLTILICNHYSHNITIAIDRVFDELYNIINLTVIVRIDDSVISRTLASYVHRKLQDLLAFNRTKKHLMYDFRHDDQNNEIQFKVIANKLIQ